MWVQTDFTKQMVSGYSRASGYTKSMVVDVKRSDQADEEVAVSDAIVRILETVDDNTS